MLYRHRTPVVDSRPEISFAELSSHENNEKKSPPPNKRSAEIVNVNGVWISNFPNIFVDDFGFEFNDGAPH